jgi:hypothetical protein
MVFFNNKLNTNIWSFRNVFGDFRFAFVGIKLIGVLSGVWLGKKLFISLETEKSKQNNRQS